MPRHIITFHFQDVPSLPAVEAAARRRARGLEAAHPAVLGWSVQVALQAAGDEGARFAASTQARIVGGRTLIGDAEAGDALAALRLAFNALELELEAEHESARVRAARWLSAVRGRLAEPFGT